MPAVLQHVAYILPFAKPVDAFRNILSKDSDFSDSTVRTAFLIQACWIAGPLALSFWLLREKKVRRQPSN
jgi:hypothetical protein